MMHATDYTGNVAVGRKKSLKIFQNDRNILKSCYISQIYFSF